MIVDTHIHLLSTQSENGGLIHPKFKRGPFFYILKRAFGLKNISDKDLDKTYITRLKNWVETSDLDKACLLAFDGVYDAQGRLDKQRTMMMVDNDYCLKICKTHPKFVPICSVNPQRIDALEELERVYELGAKAIKTLPNSQGFDPANPEYLKFWQKMADLKLPLLTHTSFEHTVPPIDQSFGKPEKLKNAPDEGVIVIAAHCAGSGTAHPFREDFHTWRTMLDHHDNLYGDISAMASLSRFAYIHKILKDPVARTRVLFGSDYPVPVNPSVFLKTLGFKTVKRLKNIENPLQRNLEIFKALGVDDAILNRGALVLNLE